MIGDKINPASELQQRSEITVGTGGYIWSQRLQLLSFLLYLIAYLLESRNEVVIIGFLGIVDDGHLLLIHRGTDFLCTTLILLCSLISVSNISCA